MVNTLPAAFSFSLEDFLLVLCCPELLPLRKRIREVTRFLTIATLPLFRLCSKEFQIILSEMGFCVAFLHCYYHDVTSSPGVGPLPTIPLSLPTLPRVETLLSS